MWGITRSKTNGTTPVKTRKPRKVVSPEEKELQKIAVAELSKLGPEAKLAILSKRVGLPVSLTPEMSTEEREIEKIGQAAVLQALRSDPNFKEQYLEAYLKKKFGGNGGSRAETGNPLVDAVNNIRALREFSSEFGGEEKGSSWLTPEVIIAFLGAAQQFTGMKLPAVSDVAPQQLEQGIPHRIAPQPKQRPSQAPAPEPEEPVDKTFDIGFWLPWLEDSPEAFVDYLILQAESDPQSMERKVLNVVYQSSDFDTLKIQLEAYKVMASDTEKEVIAKLMGDKVEWLKRVVELVMERVAGEDSGDSVV